MTSPDPPLFCPYCGARTEDVRGERTCPVGNMPLSAATESRLRAAFVERTATPSAQPLRYVAGGRWYCPGCGERMITETHDVTCPRCALHLNEFLTELIEMHRHGGTLDPRTGEAVYDGWRG